MHLRGSSVVILLVVFVALAGLLTGCGGAQSQGDASGGEEKQGGNAAKKEKTAAKIRIATGTVTFVNAETGRFIVKPPTGKRESFKFGPKTTATLGGEQAELSDIREGQDAQVRYVVKKEKNQARNVTLFSDGETSEETPEGGETTG